MGKSKRFRSGIAAICLVVASAGAACSKGSGSKAPAFSSGNAGLGSGAAVATTEGDFGIRLGNQNVAAGETTFAVENNGPSTHEFVIFRSDLPGDGLPVRGVAVDENAKGIQHIDEQEDITSGTSTTLTANLSPGKYVVICNLPLHYQLGMHATLIVA